MSRDHSADQVKPVEIGRTPSGGVALDSGQALDTDAAVRLLTEGELSIEGRLVVASNATFLGAVRHGDVSAACVYKPIRGERPLWDFPDGALAHRERAAYLVAIATGWPMVPTTVLRDGPLGPGMAQIWVEHDDESDLVDVVPVEAVPEGWLRILDAYDGEGAEVSLVHADDPSLARLAVLDVVLNNADRKGGHLLVDGQRRLYAVDHGIALHAEPKLRTVLWGWAGEPLPEDAGAALDGLLEALDGDIGAELAELLTVDEVGALRRRTKRLRAGGRFPMPSARGPAIPWPVW